MEPPWMLRMCCLRWSGRQKYLPQRVQVKVYRDPRRLHSYLECRVSDDRDLYPRPHITHRYRSSPLPLPVETYSVEGLAASIQGGFFTSRGFLPHARNEEPLFAVSYSLSLSLTLFFYRQTTKAHFNQLRIVFHPFLSSTGLPMKKKKLEPSV